MSPGKLHARCAIQEIPSEGKSDKDLREALAESTWCGYRMTKDISAERMASEYEQRLAKEVEEEEEGERRRRSM